MRNILIFAGIAGLAAAIAVYFTSTSDDTKFETIDDTATGYVTDADIEAYDQRENTGDPYPVA